ncbi:response regulator transcription factor [Paenibacillus macerans]|uniref:response regulator transcription factor n=1 Tax=Paenibacillus macerans TaxID=44252 RepID=UPI003D320558
MYRMLIVDDEEIITDGLADIFGKLNLDLDLYKAYSGQEALDLLNRTRVDIVLSDICMPGMDGLELMEAIRLKWPQCKIVFLTGHNDFNYVYQAIQAPDVQYVLKNEGYPKLIAAVERALEELEDTLRANDLIRRSKEQLHTLETLAHGDYFRNLLFHDALFERVLAEDFKRLHIPLDATLPVLIAIGNLTHAGSAGASPSYADRQETALAVKFLAEAFLAERTDSIGFIDRYGDLVWFFQPGQRIDLERTDAFEQTVMFLEGTFELIQQACLESLDTTVAVTLSGDAFAWEGLPAIYDKMRRHQHDRTGDGTRMVQRVFPNEDAPASASVRSRSLRDKSEALAAHLEAGRRAEFMRLFYELAEPAYEHGRGDPNLTELCYTIALVLLSYINRWEVREIGSFGLMQLETYHSWREAFAFLKGAAEVLFSLRKSGEQNRAAGAIHKMCWYIEQNISEDLSLVRLADEFHFNPSYLSRMFKQERGVNLSEYIDELRIRKAKELLRRAELKVAEVGWLIGYEMPQSFTRFFKKWTGLTPQEYRTDTLGGDGTI